MEFYERLGSGIAAPDLEETYLETKGISLRNGQQSVHRYGLFSSENRLLLGDVGDELGNIGVDLYPDICANVCQCRTSCLASGHIR
jgi:hypothetical protein